MWKGGRAKKVDSIVPLASTTQLANLENPPESTGKSKGFCISGGYTYTIILQR
jgi:hypothetical protein